MTQERVIRALKNGPLTSHEVANLTGMPQSSVLSTAKKLRYKGVIETAIVKSGKNWVAQYTLINKDISVSDDGIKIICGIPTYGIFTKAEYASMRAQANRLFNNQKI